MVYGMPIFIIIRIVIYRWKALELCFSNKGAPKLCLGALRPYWRIYGILLLSRSWTMNGGLDPSPWAFTFVLTCLKAPASGSPTSCPYNCLDRVVVQPVSRNRPLMALQLQSTGRLSWCVLAGSQDWSWARSPQSPGDFSSMTACGIRSNVTEYWKFKRYLQFVRK